MKKLSSLPLSLLLILSLLFCCCGCGASGSSDNHQFSMREVWDNVKGVFAGDKTVEHYARAREDLTEFQSQLIDFMEDNASMCSNGAINAESLNRYLGNWNAMVVGNNDEQMSNSKETDPWWHNYVIEIVNNRDGTGTVGLGLDKSFIYVCSGGKDKLYGTRDESKDDVVLVVQYSDGEVYSRIFTPDDLTMPDNDCEKNGYDGTYHNNITVIPQTEKRYRNQPRSGSRF